MNVAIQLMLMTGTGLALLMQVVWLQGGWQRTCEWVVGPCRWFNCGEHEDGRVTAESTVLAQTDFMVNQ